MIDPGTLRNRITLQEFSSSEDDWGQPIEGWRDVAKVWANVRFLNGKEYISADRETQQSTASVRIRRRQVNQSMRVIFDGVTYDITAVLPGPNREYVDLAVKAGDGPI